MRSGIVAKAVGTSRACKCGFGARCRVRSVVAYDGLCSRALAFTQTGRMDDGQHCPFWQKEEIVCMR
jgi:hypothetical protein